MVGVHHGGYVDTTEEAKRRTRRRHDEELKRLVLAECAAPGASVATIAMSHGLNANLVHKWRREARVIGQPATTFVPVAVAASAMLNEPAQFVELEVQRGAVSVRVRWPMSAVGSCAAWLREILR
jgi:transposase